MAIQAAWIKARQSGQGRVSMAAVCRQFGISRQAYYQQKCRDEHKETANEVVLELVRQVRRVHPQMGGRKLFLKIQPVLAAEGLKIGRDRLFSLLKANDLLVHRPKTFRRTTIPGLWRAPNRLLGLTISHPNQVWVSDITYLELNSGRFAYLFVLMDLYSRYIVGWHVAASLAADGAVVSLEKALPHLCSSSQPLIHHSDHGVQYTSHTYMKTLLDHHILPSMGAVGNCYDNIFAERLMGTLKNEYALAHPFADYSQITSVVQEVVHLYNTDRPHLALQCANPEDVYLGRSLNVPSISIPVDAP